MSYDLRGSLGIAMRYGVLGPVEARNDDDVAVRGPQQRRLLALMLSRAGQSVSTERLVDCLWPDGLAPDGANRSVTTYVSRLRTALGEGSILTVEEGYRLELGGSVLDAQQFESLLAEAGTVEPGRAVEIYDRALALWRGGAYGEFGGQWWLVAEASRLNELRIMAMEERAEALLVLGNHHRVIPELNRLTADYPLRERPVSLLMQALFATGRHAEALREFQAFRTRLGEETGLEPSSELTALERSLAAGSWSPTLRAAPLQSRRSFRRNLPAQLSPLIGRRSEIAELQVLLATDRIITLTGAAGVGKTRLALAVADDAVAHPGGVLWVELATVSDPEAIGRAALAALGESEVTGLSPVGLLADELGSEPSLLVLDNCEHLVDACAAFVMELLTANSAISVLATSREPLGLPSEITWRVPSLSCPPLDHPDIQATSEYGAVALFLDRAHRARPSFTMGEINASAVVEICHRLDGIPLALELAAVRFRQMSVERIATELNDRFKLLTGGPRTLVPRQQTVEASVDWSYDRLDVRERSAFRRLGVFVGRFPMEAAEALVPASGGPEASAVFELISLLVDKSLVVVDDSANGNSHYRLLETLRAYALDRLQAEEELERLRKLHATWWTDWLEPRAANPSGASLDEIDLFFDNLTAALEWSAGEPQLGLRLLFSMAKIGQDIGRAADVVAAADRLLTQENADAYGHLWLNAAGAMSIRYDVARGYDELLALAERMTEVATRLGDEYHLALARFRISTDANDALVLRELATLRDDSFVASVAAVIHAQMIGEGDPVAGTALIEQAEGVAATVVSRIPGEYARRTRGRIARDTGELRRSIELARTLTTSRSPLIVLNGVRLLGDAGLLARDVDALRFAVEVAERAQRGTSSHSDEVEQARHRLSQVEGRDTSRLDRALGGARPSSLGTLWLICREALDAGHADVALGAVQGLQSTTPHARAVRAAIEAAVTGDEDRWQAALCAAADHGLRLLVVDAMEGLAVGAADNLDHIDCLRISAAAARLREDTGYRWRFHAEQNRIEAARRKAIAALADRAEDATAEGRDLAWQDAVAYAIRIPRRAWATPRIY